MDFDAIPELDEDMDELLEGAEHLDEAGRAELRAKVSRREGHGREACVFRSSSLGRRWRPPPPNRLSLSSPLPLPLSPPQFAARAAARRDASTSTSTPALSLAIHRPVDPFDTWVWFRAGRPLSDEDLDLLDGVWTAWHLLGRLGAFNGANLQLYHGAGIAAASYDAGLLESATSSVFHDAGGVEGGPGSGGGSSGAQGGGGSGGDGGAPPPGPAACWARAWVNLGTADELALDILANALGVLATE